MNFSTSECVHCGLCLEACPTYRVTGAEDQSPRGRIHLIRAVEETRLTRDQTASALDACLLCRACETACPSDVPFHTLLAEHREGHSRPLRRLLRWGLTAATPLRFLGGMLRLARRWRILAVVERWGPARLRNLARSVPQEPQGFRPHPGTGFAAEAPRRGRVGLHLGCVQSQFLGATQEALVRLLTGQGFEVWIPAQPSCCGALHAHDGEAVRGKTMAEDLGRAFPQDLAAVLSTSAGCLAHLQETGQTGFQEPAHFLQEVGLRGRPRALPLPAVWDPPCHLPFTAGGQTPILQLLQSIPELKLLPSSEADLCCGAGGLSFLGNPLSADAVLARKVAQIRASGAQECITANPGCQIDPIDGKCKMPH